MPTNIELNTRVMVVEQRPSDLEAKVNGLGTRVASLESTMTSRFDALEELLISNFGESSVRVVELDRKVSNLDAKVANIQTQMIAEKSWIDSRFDVLEELLINKFDKSLKKMSAAMPEVESLKDVHGKLVAIDTQSREIEESGVADGGNQEDGNMFVEMPMLNNITKWHELVKGCEESSVSSVSTSEVLSLYNCLSFDCGGFHYVERAIENGLVNKIISGNIEEVTCVEMNINSSRINKGSVKSVGGGNGGADLQLTVGLRILVVDENPTCLAIFKKMLRSCPYDVKKLNLKKIRVCFIFSSCLVYDPGGYWQYIRKVVIRENTEGKYAGLELEIVPGVVRSLKVITKSCSEHIAKYAIEYAFLDNGKKVTVVHKANIMKLADCFFLESCREVATKYPTVGIAGATGVMLGGSTDTNIDHALEYLNQMFPTEASLSGVEPLMQKIHNEIRRVDVGILTTVRQKNNSGNKAQEDLAAATYDVGKLMYKIREIKTKVEQSETMLQVMVSRRQYKEAAAQLETVNQLCSHYEAYRDISKIIELREKFKSIKQILKSRIFSDFSSLGGKETDENNLLQHLSDACLVVDALEPSVIVQQQGFPSSQKVGAGEVTERTLPHVRVEGQFLVESVAMLERRMIKCNIATVSQVLVQWSSTSPMDAHLGGLVGHP